MSNQKVLRPVGFGGDQSSNAESPSDYAREAKAAGLKITLYEAAVRRGLPSNVPVLKELPFLSELHKVH